MARISVLMPVFNVGPYVAEALASIQNQTLADIEVIVIDDCSTDETPQIVAQAAVTDPRVKVFRTPQNLGLPSALNFGLPFCRSPFIARMDGDDISLPTRLETQLRYLAENPRISLVGCAFLSIDESGDPIPGVGISQKPITQEAIRKTMLLATPCSHWMARRELYEALSGYREISVSEDFDFLLRAVTSRFLLGNTVQPLLRYRMRRGQNSGSVKQRKAHDYVVRLYRKRVKFGKDSFSVEEYRRAIRTSKFQERAFQIAQKCNLRGIGSGSRSLRYFLAAVSAFISVWQVRYFIDRARFRMAWIDSQQ